METGDAGTCLAFIQFAARLLQFHLSTKSPPEVKLGNSLLFCPGLGRMRQTLIHQEFPWLSSLPTVEQVSYLVLRGHGDWVRSCVYSPNGDVLASSSDDETVHLWDPRTGLLQGILQGFTGWVYRVKFSTTGLLATMESGIIKIWDDTTCTLHQPLLESSAISSTDGEFNDIDFSPDGNMLAIAMSTETVIWDIKSQSVKRYLAHPEVTCVRFLGNEAIVLCNRTVVLARVEDAGPGRELVAIENCTGCVSISPDSQWLATGLEDSLVGLCRLGSENPAIKTLRGHSGDVTSVSFSQDGSRLASVNDDKEIIIWNLKGDDERLERKLLGHNGTVSAVSFSPMGNQLASSSYDRYVLLWNIDSEMETKANSELETKADDADIQSGPSQIHTQPISSVRFSRSGERLASGCEDGLVCLWDGHNGNHLHSLTGHESRILWLCFSSDDESLAATSVSGETIIWGTRDGSRLHHLQGHTDWVRNADFSPTTSRNAQLLASASDDCTVRVWDLVPQSEDTPYRELNGHTNWVHCVAFSADGNLLASAGDDFTVLLWDCTNLWNRDDEAGPEVPKMRVNFDSSRAVSMAFCPFDQRLVVSDDDGYLYTWDIDGTEVLGQPSIKGGEAPFLSIQFDDRFPDWILTDIGAIHLNISSSSIDASTTTLSEVPWRLSADMDWIKWMENNMVFLPKQYRPTDCARWVQGCQIAVGSKSGRILLFNFDKDMSPYIKK